MNKRPIFISFLFILFLQLFFVNVTNAEQYVSKDTNRVKENINIGWKFHRGDIQGAEAVDFDDSSWDSVVLPHTFKQTDYMASTWYRGIGWYRKEITLSENDQSKKINVYFEGAKTTTEVYINGKKLDTHYGGYTPFNYDITDYVDFGEKNIIAVKVDNTYQEQVAPEKPDGSYIGFNMFGGIFRDVYLIKTDKLHVPEAIHSWNNNWEENGGVFVTSSNISEQSADVKVQTWVNNSNASSIETTVVSTIVDANDQIIETVESAITIGKNEVKEFTHEMNVNNPNLWSPWNPYLYQVKTEVYQGETIVDNYETTFGIRKTEWTKSDGFFLNDQHVKIYGVNQHQDWPYIGDAVPNNQHYLDVKRVKDAGANFVRDAHYLYDDAFMDAADELGVMQWVEIAGWGNINPASFGEEWRQSNKDALYATIRVARNHPSIVIWGAGINEMQQDVALETELNNIAHQEDPTRATSMGRNYNTDNNIFDVYGRNAYTEEQWKNQGLHNGSPDPDSYGLINTEHTGHMYETWRDADEERLINHALAIQKMTELGRDESYVHGSLVWEMHDHHHQISVVRPHGLTDAGRIPKFAYYWSKSQSADVNYDGSVNPMVFIANYWTPDSPTNVTVFSNTDQVRFSTWNGTKWTEFATKDPEDINVAHPHFEFNLNAHNTSKIKAEGLIDGKVVATHVVEEPENPSALELKTDASTIDGNGSDITSIEFYIKDENGTVVPYSTNEVDFQISGPGELIGGPSIKAVNGANMILVKSTGAPGTIEVTASSDGLVSDTIQITANDVGVSLPQAKMTVEDLTTVIPGKPVKVTATLENAGKVMMEDVNLTLNLPEGFTVEEDTPILFEKVDSNEKITATFTVTANEQVSMGDHTFIARADFTMEDESHAINARTNIKVVPPLPDGAKWLSDLEWESADNGWGPVEKDSSVGEDLAGDGNPLTINGITYQKGLGVHAPSEIVYNIGGNYSRFTSEIGVDDEITSTGSVGFEIWGDGEKLFNSELITYEDDAKFVDVNVEGVNELKLIVTGGGNGVGSDHANWANAKLIADEGAGDQTAPTIITKVNGVDFEDEITLTETEKAQFTWEANDLESGLAYVLATFDGEAYKEDTVIDLDNKIGEHQLVVVAVDKVGNVKRNTYVINVKPNSPNLALNQPVSFSSEQTNPENNLASHANDGDRNTRWAATDGTLPQWWQVDLGAVKQMNKIEIFFNEQLSRTYEYDIELSTDNETFTKVIREGSSNNSGDTIVTLPTQDARYVRITISGVAPSNWWASIKEVQIFNDSKITELEDLIKSAKAITNDNGVYTEESYQLLQNAIVSAEEILESDKTDDAVTTSLAALQAAMDGLEEVSEPDPEVDTTELEDLIVTAEAISNEDDKYTETTFASLQTAITDAKSVLDSIETEQELAETVAALQAAMDGLEDVSEPDPEVDTKELEDLIATAEAISNEDDKYTETTFASLQTAITDAKSVLDSIETEQELAGAVAALQTAMDGLEEVSESDPNDDTNESGDSSNTEDEDEDSSKDENGENQKQSSEEDDDELPNTATPMYNWIVIGLLSIIMGGIWYLFYRRKLFLSKK
ncbi:Beta-galactosidase [Paraliobacillus sp. PM-2]|uniref:NPCBM/NEW2 domain-containing protein n=1 Tax=Paraliobacillus sp. PM-2 TaxID=1462524 RepID=UPI00061C8028|nr:NPCBM/NEW2 domain-containing protein [Paraliobacillus sp. PM-2]CQR47246.1 Beta-galactosidase [Paraliobacillus sp. PM-2]